MKDKAAEKKIVGEFAVVRYDDGSWDWAGLDKFMLDWIETNPVPWHKVPVYLGIALQCGEPLRILSKKITPPEESKGVSEAARRLIRLMKANPTQPTDYFLGCYEFLELCKQVEAK